MVEVDSDALSPPSPPTTAATVATNNGGFGEFFQWRRPKLRVTTEYDSESSAFLHKVSCKLLDNLAKFKLSFQNNSKGEVLEPQISFISKYFSLHYDLEESDSLLKTSFDVAPGLQFRTSHRVKVYLSFRFFKLLVIHNIWIHINVYNCVDFFWILKGGFLIYNLRGWNNFFAHSTRTTE